MAEAGSIDLPGGTADLGLQRDWWWCRWGSLEDMGEQRMPLGVLARSLWRLKATWQFQDCWCRGKGEEFGRLESLRAGWKARQGYSGSAAESATGLE